MVQRRAHRGFAPKNDHEITYQKLAIVLGCIILVTFVALCLVVGILLYRLLALSVPAARALMVRALALRDP